ncbi:MAG: hypothetical protein HYY85_02600 [Deltaproteobacteria bacterium]|nr:hypothetical protein [Deltaproteobacteria bacterium]
MFLLVIDTIRKHPWLVLVAILFLWVGYLQWSRAKWIGRAVDARMQAEQKKFEERLEPFAKKVEQLTQEIQKKVAEADRLQAEVEQLKQRSTELASRVNRIRAANAEVDKKLEAIGKVTAEELVNVDEQKSLKDIAEGLRRSRPD